MNTAIWWVRRDLRLTDNQALAAALGSASVVIPVFILDPQLLGSSSVGQARLAFLFEGLRALDGSLRRRGSALIIREGHPLDALHALCEETGAEGIFAEADISPYAHQRDHRVGRSLPLNLVPGVTFHPPEILRKADNTPYTVFTPFSRMWRNLPFSGGAVAEPEWLPLPPDIPSLGIPSTPRHPTDSIFPAGEGEAHRRLDAFIAHKIDRYALERDRMDLEGTSGLSPYLRLGMISARQVVLAAHEAEERSIHALAQRGAETWMNELIWREFYAAILHHFPHCSRMAFRPALRTIPWRYSPADFSAWAEGHTGYPVVDAAMRQLNTTAWMHNRARMIAASFLIKDLLIDWQLGERYFMQHLLDGDPAANNGGWQWTAGTGADAAPYFRVFNPTLQGLKFDPRGNYVRRWVPELARVPDKFIHEPWKMPANVQRSAGCAIGRDYPGPMIDHAFARDRMLSAYRIG